MRMPLLCALAVAVLPSTSQADIPLRDFFKNPEKSGFSLSPDGKLLAFRQPWERRMNVFVQPVAGGPAKRITDEKARDVAGFFWKGNEHIVFLKDFKGDENFHLVSVKTDGTDLRDLTPGAKVRADVVDDLYDDDHELLLSTNERKPEIFDVYRFNV